MTEEELKTNSELVYYRLSSMETLLREIKEDQRNALKRIDERLEGHSIRMRPLEDELREVKPWRMEIDDHQKRMIVLEIIVIQLRTTIRLIGFVVAPALSIAIGLAIKAFAT